jgi:hypothetical protein
MFIANIEKDFKNEFEYMFDLRNNILLESVDGALINLSFNGNAC